jgi:hypothetical protein
MIANIVIWPSKTRHSRNKCAYFSVITQYFPLEIDILSSNAANTTTYLSV